MFAPVIETVINLVYKLMKAIQSLVYAFSGINIFAKSTASSMNKTAGSASKASKSLNGVHSEINNVSDNNSGGGSGSVSPTMDLSQVDGQMSSFAQKLYDFFAPLKQSWDTYGTQVIASGKNAIAGILTSVGSMWNSVENIISNGTVYSIISNILDTIGNIGQAWANAWNNNNNGDQLIQNIATMINDMGTAIENITASEGFQKFLDGVLNAFTGLSELIQPIVDDFTAFIEPIAEIALSTVGTVLTAIGDALKWIGDNEVAVTIVEALAIAIGIVTVATTLFKAVKALETGVLIANAAAWVAANLPIILITAAITAVIAIIILCVKHWETIKETVINVCSKIKEIAVSVWNKIKDTISNVIEKIKTGITNVLTKIKTTWNNIWNGIKTVVSNVWNGIWSTIKKIVNKILGGIENFVNGTIKGINKLLSGISKVANAVGSLIGLKPINLQLSTISLPRLATGNVAYSETVAVFGEYSGARNNPEITTPQNIMRETFADVLSDYQFNNSNNSNGEIKQLVFQFGSYRVAVEMENLLRQARRQNGVATVPV